MAKAQKTEPQVEQETIEPSTELAIVQKLTPAVIFQEGGAMSVVEKIRKEFLAHDRDPTTEDGRKIIKSLARKVSNTKTGLDEAGGRLIVEHRNVVNTVNAERKIIRDEMDKLRDEIRKPVDDFEAAEAERVKAHEEALEWYRQMAILPAIWHSSDVRQRLDTIKILQPRNWQEFSERAKVIIDHTVLTLTGLYERGKKAEDEAEELERLRKEAAAREQKDREDKIAAEAAETARKEAERIAKEAADKAEAEKQALIKAAQDAAEKAERDKLEAAAEAKRLADKAEQDKIDAKAEIKRVAEKAQQDRIDAEKRAKEAAEQVERDKVAAAKKAEDDRLAAIETERKRVAAEQEKERLAAEAREADKVHRKKINNEALEALMNAGMERDHARIAIEAIVRGNVPHVKISY